MRLMRALGAGVTLLAAASLPIPSTEAATLTPISCPMTITESIVAANSVFNCVGTALTVNGPDITINLNGHTIDGDAVGSDRGVLVAPGQTGVRVINGTIKEFHDGVVIANDAHDASVSGLMLAANTEHGLFLASASRATITRNEMIDNAAAGIFVAGDTGVISSNLISRNADGIETTLPGNDNQIKKNRIIANLDDGILLGSVRNIVTGNRIAGHGGDGVEITGSDNQLLKNRIQGNSQDGIEIPTSVLTTLAKNVVEANNLAGVFIWDPLGPGLGGNQNTLIGNTFRRNRLEGIRTEPDTDFTRVEKNKVYDNGSDGMWLRGLNPMVSKNKVWNNGFTPEDGGNFGIRTDDATPIGEKNKVFDNDVAIPAVQCSPNPAGFCLAAPSAAPTSLTPISCGMPAITTSIVAANSIFGCAGTALTINGFDITINLNGHTIDGDGVGADSGILVLGSRTGVTIRNGTIKDFQDGITYSTAANDGQVSALTLAGNTRYGLDVLAVRTDVRGNDILDNAVAGIFVDAGSNVIASNLIARNADGITLDDFPNGTVVSKNRILANLDDGVVHATNANTVQVTRNRIAGNGGDGIEIGDAAGNVVSGNVIQGNGQDGVEIVSGGSNTISKNVIDANALGGVYIQDPAAPSADGNLNKVIANTIRNSHFEGVRGEADTDGTTVEKNMIYDNGDDGMWLRGDNPHVSKNKVWNNGFRVPSASNFGIRTDDPTPDGEKNKVFGNDVAVPAVQCSPNPPGFCV